MSSRAPWVAHFGFTHTPFRKTIPASQLCERASHQEAVARIRFCIGESLLGVITGEVGVGKTPERSARLSGHVVGHPGRGRWSDTAARAPNVGVAT